MKSLKNKIRGIFSKKVLIYFLTYCLLTNTWLPAVMALEEANVIRSSGASPVQWGDLSVIDTQNGAIIDWSNFNTSAGQSVTFNQYDVLGGALSSTSAVLNRITSASATQFDGALSANGRVFIVNPAGVLFGSTATVNVTQLFASSLDISDGDFLSGNYELFAGEGIGEVANYGIINASEGAALIGRRVINAGTISTGNGGFVVMTAGDRVLLGKPGSQIIVEMDSVNLSDPENPEGLGEVRNESTGQISSPSGTVVLAAGDTFSTAIRVESGVGTVVQNGTIHADGSNNPGSSYANGGSVNLTSADKTVLGTISQITANAGTTGQGGQVVAHSLGGTIFEDGAKVEAKGGNVSGEGGFFELSGKEYMKIEGDIDLTAAEDEYGTFLIDPLNLTIVDYDPPQEDGGFTGPGGEWQPSGPGSELDIDILEGYLETANVTLSTVGTVGPEEGDVIFDADRYVHTDIGVDNSLIVKAERNITFTANDGINFEGNGHVELYAGGEGSVTSVDRGKNPPNISTEKGDIIIHAGRGGIDMGVLQAGNPSTSGEERPGEIRLQTIPVYDDIGTIAEDGEYDITVQHLDVQGKGYGSVYVNAFGDLTINGSSELGGAVHVKTVTTADNEDARTFVCLSSEKDVTLNGDVLAEGHGTKESTASIWIGAGTHNEDPIEGYYGTVTINGNVQANATATGTIKSDATVRIYGSTINLNGSKDPEAISSSGISYSGTVTGYNDSPDAVYEKKDPEDPDPIDPLVDTLVSGRRALVEIDTTKDATCLDCANIVRIVLPVAVDDTWMDSKNIAVVVEVLFNDKESAEAAEGTLIGGTVALSSTTSTNGGTLTLVNGDTEVQYTPPADWADHFVDGQYEDTFSYYAVDAQGEVSQEPALVVITLTNQNPVAQADAYESDHNVLLNVTGDPLADVITGTVPATNGDYDPDNSIEGRFFDDVLTAHLDTDATYGTVVLNADGTFTYTPNGENAGGSDSFTYYVTDGFGGQSQPVTVDISLSNQNPVAQPDTYDSGHNVVLNVTGDPLADVISGVVPLENGDYDPDNEIAGRVFDDVLTAVLDTDASYGTVILNGDGTFTYTPSQGNPGGSDSFTYYVTDGHGGQSQSVTVNLVLSNQAPIAQPDAYDSGHNVVLDVTGDPLADVITGVVPLDNGDHDPDNEIVDRVFDDVLTAVLDTDATYGTVALNGDGTFTYTPSPGNPGGSDSFTYYVTDGHGGQSDPVTVDISLSNQAPVAQPDTYDSSHNVELDVTGNPLADVITGVVPLENGDTDPDNEIDGRVFDDVLTAVLDTDATYGTVALNGDGTFTYTPSPSNLSGADSFTYHVTDGYGGQSGTVTVDISLSNQAPVANPDVYIVKDGYSYDIPTDQGTIEGLLPMYADYDPDNINPNKLFDDELTAVLDDGGMTTQGGSVTLNPDGSFTYTPPSNFVGTDTFSYYVNDQYGGTSPIAEVQIFVDIQPFIPATPGLTPVEIVSSGCPGLIKWAAQELGVESQQINIGISNSLASGMGIQPCDACGKLRAAALVLQDSNGDHIAALRQVVNQFAPNVGPPTEEQMASIAQAITNNYSANKDLALAGAYLDALSEYVDVLNVDLGFSQTESIQFAVNNYVDKLVESGDLVLAAFIAKRLNAPEIKPAPEVPAAPIQEVPAVPINDRLKEILGS